MRIALQIFTNRAYPFVYFTPTFIMIANLRNRYMFFAAVSLLFLFSTTWYMRGYPVPATIREHLPTPKQKPAEEEAKPVHHIKYKPEPTIKSPPIVDNFPLAAAAHSAADLPPIPSWNKPPSKHVDEVTPLFIGFTRNWPLLQQVVVSYITAGWPVEDIYVVENTGVMDSNARGLLSLQNPFFVNHTRLNMFGVNILRTPALLTFAQLQNFYLHTAIEKEWPNYFWSHSTYHLSLALSILNKYANLFFLLQWMYQPFLSKTASRKHTPPSSPPPPIIPSTNLYIPKPSMKSAPSNCSRAPPKTGLSASSPTTTSHLFAPQHSSK